MNKTKSRVLEKSLEIFNEKGVINTTLRQIAQALGISQGNLNYHFKTKNEIIETLYFDLVERMDEQMNDMISEKPLLHLLAQSSYATMQNFYDYRFLMRDFYLILRENEKIKTHYLALEKLRKQQFMQIFNSLVDENLLRKESFDKEYERLFERMNILGDNWINSLELLDRKVANPVKYYSELLFETLFPYLTEKGRNSYLQLNL